MDASVRRTVFSNWNLTEMLGATVIPILLGLSALVPLFLCYLSSVVGHRNSNDFL